MFDVEDLFLQTKSEGSGFTVFRDPRQLKASFCSSETLEEMSSIEKSTTNLNLARDRQIRRKT